MPSPIRFGGMVSGLDTDRIIKELMRAERAPVNKLQRQKQLQEWKRDAYREMNSLLLELRNTIDSLRFSGSFNKKIATSQNQDVVAAKSIGKPSLSTYTVQVVKLATEASPPAHAFQLETTPGSTTEQLGASFTFSVQKGDSTISIEVAETDSIDIIMQRVNAENIGVKASYLNGKLVFTSTDDKGFKVSVTEGDGTKLGMSGDTLVKDTQPYSVELTPALNNGKFTKSFTFSVAGKEISVSADEKIEDVINRINDENINVDAKYENGKIIFSSTTQFSVNKIAGDSEELGLEENEIAEKRHAGKVIINGIEHEITSNTFTYDGIEFNVKQASSTPIVVNTKVDEDAIFNQIKTFVDKYNEVIEKINSKINEPKVRGYEPLLDEEREALPEKTAEKLEAMARSGILARDSILKSGLDAMRFLIVMEIEGVNKSFDTLAEIGITGAPPGKNAYLENGKLYINEDKLREAIRNNSEDVTKLFTNYVSAGTENRDKQLGIAERLYNQLKKTMDAISERAGNAGFTYDDSVISRSIREIDDQISRWEVRLQQIEDRYWKQFTAMEKAMQKAYEQGTWFLQQMGMGAY